MPKKIRELKAMLIEAGMEELILHFQAEGKSLPEAKLVSLNQTAIALLFNLYTSDRQLSLDSCF